MVPDRREVVDHLSLNAALDQHDGHPLLGPYKQRIRQPCGRLCIGWNGPLLDSPDASERLRSQTYTKFIECQKPYW